MGKKILLHFNRQVLTERLLEISVISLKDKAFGSHIKVLFTETITLENKKIHKRKAFNEADA